MSRVRDTYVGTLLTYLMYIGIMYLLSSTLRPYFRKPYSNKVNLRNIYSARPKFTDSQTTMSNLPSTIVFSYFLINYFNIRKPMSTKVMKLLVVIQTPRKRSLS